MLNRVVRGREPKFETSAVLDRVVLSPYSATMDDCCRLQELVETTAKGDILLTSGVLEIINSVELAVTAVYTNGDRALEVAAVTPKSA